MQTNNATDGVGAVDPLDQFQNLVGAVTEAANSFAKGSGEDPLNTAIGALVDACAGDEFLKHASGVFVERAQRLANNANLSAEQLAGAIAYEADELYGVVHKQMTGVFPDIVSISHLFDPLIASVDSIAKADGDRAALFTDTGKQFADAVSEEVKKFIRGLGPDDEGAKSFAELQQKSDLNRMLEDVTGPMYQVVGNLTQSIQTILGDDAIQDKGGAIELSIGEFNEWLQDRVSQVLGTPRMGEQELLDLEQDELDAMEQDGEFEEDGEDGKMGEKEPVEGEKAEDAPDDDTKKVKKSEEFRNVLKAAIDLPVENALNFAADLLTTAADLADGKIKKDAADINPDDWVTVHRSFLVDLAKHLQDLQPATKAKPEAKRGPVMKRDKPLITIASASKEGAVNTGLTKALAELAELKGKIAEQDQALKKLSEQPAAGPEAARTLTPVHKREDGKPGDEPVKKSDGPLVFQPRLPRA